VSGSTPNLRDDIYRVFTPVVSNIASKLDRLEYLTKHGSGDQSPHGRKGSGEGPEEKDPKSRELHPRTPARDRQYKVRYEKVRAQLRKDLLEIDRLSKIQGTPMGMDITRIEETQMRAGELIAYLKGEMD
jgi:hypothetical protein